MSREFEKMEEACGQLSAMMEVVAEKITPYLLQVGETSWKLRAQIESAQTWKSDSATLIISFVMGSDFSDNVIASTPLEAITEFLRRKGWKVENEPKPMPTLIEGETEL